MWSCTTIFIGSGSRRTDWLWIWQCNRSQLERVQAQCWWQRTRASFSDLSCFCLRSLGHQYCSEWYCRWGPLQQPFLLHPIFVMLFHLEFPDEQKTLVNRIEFTSKKAHKSYLSYMWKDFAKDWILQIEQWNYFWLECNFQRCWWQSNRMWPGFQA